MKLRKCKGTGRAEGIGCGKLIKEHKFGVGIDCCYRIWLITTSEGAKEIQKVAERAKKKVEAKKRADDYKEKVKRNLDIMSAEEYRRKILQPSINLIARLIDLGQPCISTGNLKGKMSGGHYVAAGDNRTLCYNLHNVFIQSFHSNHHKSGSILNYQDGLISTYGLEYFTYIQSLRKHPKMTLSKVRMIEVNNRAKEIIKELNKENKTRNSEERIDTRNKINNRLGIYKEPYCTFTTIK